MLRDVTRADLATLHALDQQCFPPGIAYSRAEFSALLNHPSASAIAALTAEDVVGFAIVQPARRTLARTGRVEPVLHLITIDVSPGARRQGIGATLMEWALGRGRGLGFSDMLLEVAVDNQAAIAFYQRCGFLCTGDIPGYYGGNLDAFTMERAL